ncbi:MAG: SGNH/GDSL hydrolase family protein [Nanobdellota archaeon]
MVKILVFGDSIAWGAFDTESGGWVERLKTHFLETYEEEGVGVYNLSVASNDTRGVLAFLESDIAKIDAIEKEDYILLFSIGSNDPRIQEETFIPESEFRDNLQQIISIAQKHSQHIFFTGLMKVDEGLTRPWDGIDHWKNEDLQAYDAIIAQKCVENAIHFISLMECLDASDLSDGLHPNTRGHKKIYEQVKAVICDFLDGLEE